MRPKRPKRPVADYREHESYPSAEQAGLTRRGFLRVALAGGAAAVGSVIWDRDVEARRLRGVIRRPSYRVSIAVKPEITCPTCKGKVRGVMLRSYSATTRNILQKPRHKLAMERIARRELGHLTCHADDHAARSAMGQKIARAIGQYFAQQTGKPAPHFYAYLSWKAPPKPSP